MDAVLNLAIVNASILVHNYMLYITIYSYILTIVLVFHKTIKTNIKRKHYKRSLVSETSTLTDAFTSVRMVGKSLSGTP